MGIQTQRIRLDVSKDMMPPTVYLRQGDRNGTRLEVEVTDGGAAYPLSSYGVRFCLRMPHSGGSYEVDGTASGNLATFEIDETYAAAVAGRSDTAFVQVLSGETVICSTSSANVVVRPSHSEGVEPATAWSNGVEQFLADARDDLDAAIVEAAETAAEHQADAIAAKIPWPTQSGGSGAESGAEGQVLLSNGDGTTSWGAVGTEQLENGAVITEKIGDGSVTAQKLAQNAVTSQKLSGGAVTDDKLDPSGVLSDVQTLRHDLDNLDVTVDPDDFSLYQDPDTGLVYVMYRGEQGSDGIPLAGGGGGGGGGGNNAVITVTNQSGWLSRTVSTGAACVVTLEWSSLEDNIPTGDGALTVTVGGVVRLARSVAQGQLTIDLGPYLSTGSNKCKVNVADVYGNSRTVTFSVNCVELSILSSFDTSGAFTAGQAIEYTYVPKGAIEKTVHFELDGTELPTETVTTSGRQQTKSIPAMQHGAHYLRVWFECSIDEQTVSSNELYHALVVVDPASSAPIVATPFRATTAKQYEMLQIPYTVYTPNSITSQVVLSANGAEVQAITVGRSEQTWSYRCQGTGALTLGIASGTASKALSLTVSESDIDAHAETENLALHLTSYGRSNGEAHPEVWEDSDNGISCTLTGFNWQSNGWVQDPDGITVLRVNNGAGVTIPYRPFASDFRATGKTLEFEFAARDVLDYDSVPIGCMSGGRGFQLTAQRATLKSEQSEISTQYKEDEHVRVSIVAEKRAENRLLLVYINGIASGVVQYPTDDDFSQQTPVDITLGDDGITLDVYNVRVYDNDLTRYQILDNWIADTQDVALMLERYQRNEVYDEYGKVVIEQLPDDLPYFILEAEELPQYKGDKKTIGGIYVDPQNPAKGFTFTGCQINVQGTSSAPYYRKNYDMQFKGGFEMRAGHADSYELASGVVPFNRFVLKADVASSEGANNVELVKLYNDLDPYIQPEREDDPRVRDGIYGFPIVVFWHDTASGDTRFMGKYNFNLPKRAPGPYGYSGDMESWEFQNNTSDLMLFRTDRFDQTMVTDPTTGEAKEAWRYDYEARFPEDTWTDTAKLQELQSFVVACDRSKATGDAIAPVTYDGVTYSTDTAAYRLAKFRAEFGKYAEVSSFVFYYIFTELFLMVDSRAKNLFIGFSGSDAEGTTAIDRKAVAEPYDMDTALGTNNEGSLVFGYSLEDTDQVSGANVFNGQDSVLWCNVRDAFPGEIVARYQALRAGGLSYANVMRRFSEHQGKWPEAVFNEDSWTKYIEPLVGPEGGKEPTDVYLPMMQGSKAEQRKWWLYNRFRYMDSKWNAGDALSDVIQLRGYAKADITVTPYADIYPTVKYGSYIVAQRGSHGVPATLACPIDTLNDTEIYIYSAPQLASVGDLSGLKVGFADFSKATKLQSIKVGSDAAGYSNPNLTGLGVGQNNLLATVDARNCTALAGTVDLGGAANLEHVYMEGTAVTSVTLPVGGILKTLHLPETVTNLTVRGHAGITSFSVEGDDYSNVTTLRVEGSPAIPVDDILAEMPANSRVRIVGLVLTMSTTAEVEAFYDILDTMRGLDEAGGNVDRAVVAGTITGLGAITGSWLAEMEARYPNIEIGYESLTSNLRYWSWDGQTLLHTESVADGGDGTWDGAPTRESTAHYDFGFDGWSTETDAQAGDADATKAVTLDRDVYAAYSRTVRKYTVRFLNVNGTVLQTVQDVPYGGSATYTGSTPTHPTEPQDNAFEGWEPAPTNIQGATDCVAKYRYLASMLTGIIERTIKKAGASTATKVRTYAFASCYSLSSLAIPNAELIDERAFYYCPNIRSASFPAASVVGSQAFASCGMLSVLDLPLVESIGNGAFQYCYRLAELHIEGVSSVPIIGSYVFNSTPIIGYRVYTQKSGSVYVPASLYESFISAPGWSSIASCIVSVS